MTTVETFDDMVGKTYTKVEHTTSPNHEDRLIFHGDGECFEFYHSQDCCESVSIEDICGDLADLAGSPLLVAEECSTEDAPIDLECESYTWTFYRFATVKGTVTVRWFGSSNGYYGEGVDRSRRTCEGGCAHEDWADCENN